MEIAISTASLNPSTPAAIERAWALGFTQVEINLQPDEFGYDYKRKTNARFYRSLARTLAEKKLSVWSTTTPPLTQQQMFSARARKDILMSSAIAAGMLGSRVFVASGLDVFRDEDLVDAYFERGLSPPVVDGFDEAWVQAVNRRVSMAICNEDFWIGLPLLNRPDRLDKVSTDLAVGIAFDLRQALRRGNLDIWLDKVGDRIAVAYLYDESEDGRRCAPIAEEWRDWLPALSQTRLKTVVLVAHPDQSDVEISQSRDFIAGILQES